MRQINAYNPIKPPHQPPINSNIDPLDAVLSGCQKIKEDPELRELLYKVYNGLIP